jgi:hypothetical protein
MAKRARFDNDDAHQRHKAVVGLMDFASLDGPHPYGVLPGGNQFLCSSTTTTTDATANQNRHNPLLHDECWGLILEFCDATSLGNLVQTCRSLYVWGHAPELWRDLFLRRMEHATIASAGPTWKDAYVRQFHSYNRPHVPIAMPGMYSDRLYRLHTCRSFGIPEAWLRGDECTVPRVPVNEMTMERFLDEFEIPNRPVLIQGAAVTWPAYRKWYHGMPSSSSNTSFRATSGVAPLPAHFTLAAYTAYCASTHLEEAPLYLFDRSALLFHSPLWCDFALDLPRTCPYWDPHHHDLFQVVGDDGRRPDHTWLIVGPQRSGSVFHIDPNATHAWNATIVGRKRWIFYPPGVPPPGVHPSVNGDQVALPLSVGEWMFSFWQDHQERMRSSSVEERPLECTAMPGDVCFVPHGWWHMVINLDAMNVAITHNYVSRSNLPNVLRFLRTKQDQISGCRDRADSIKPDQLYNAFVQGMRQHNAAALEEALAVPDWTCNAWKENPSASNDNRPKAKHSTDKEEEEEEEPPAKRSMSLMEKVKADSSTFSFSFL